jgi:hypothetical protein
MRRILIIPVLLGLVWTALLIALFTRNIIGERRHVMDIAERQAKAFFQQVVSTRAWNSLHGGIYVPLGPLAEPNPYLPEQERVQRMESGQILVKINPAYMTRQLASIAEARSGVIVHITSLKPIRAENAPDAWEREALSRLEPGGEFFELVPAPGGDLFRYIAPLTAEASCLQCHVNEHEGDVRGGINVSLHAGPLLSYFNATAKGQAVSFGVIWLTGILGLGGCFLEINRKREKAENLSLVKSRFLANMSHDMRTPLNGIIRLAGRMLRQDSSPRDAQYARLMVHSAKSLLEMVNDILEFARLDSGRLELKPRPFDPRLAVTRAADIFAFAAGEKFLDFSWEVDPDVPPLLCGDDFRFRQVLANLLGNAVKFTERGFVRLNMRAAQTGNGLWALRTEVQDSGVGIAAEHLESIFECFSQAEDCPTHRHAGSGLGLSIARQLARLMGGDVTVASTPGQGSRFTFTALLRPCAPGETVPEQDAADLAASGGLDLFLPGCRFLVVDDHGVNRVLLRDVLRECGAEVQLAQDGFAALKLFEQERFDLVFMDLQMPGMDGAKAIRNMRGIEHGRGQARTPILVLTAFAVPEEAADLPSGEIDGVLGKPLDLGQLREAILRAAPGRRDTAIPPADGGRVEEPAAGPLLELEPALRLLDGRRDLYASLVDEFLTSAESLQQELEAATARGDNREAMRLAHTVKTGAATVGASRLRVLATALETRARAQEPLAPEHGQDLRGTLNQTVQALKSAVARP